MVVHQPARPDSFEALSAFVAVLAHGADQSTLVERLMEQLVEQLVDALDARCATVGLLHHDGQLRTVAAHPPSDHALCDLLHAADSSPAMTVVGDQELLAVRDVSAHEERWPVVGTLAREHGVHAVLAIPLVVGVGATGAVSVLASARDWTEEEVALARAMTDLVALLAANAEAGREDAARVRQLQHALDSRVVIEQAKGVLAAAESITVDQAYARLRAFARSHNAKVADVATAVVRLNLRPGPGH